MNKKNYFIFAAAIALASCSVDEYMGENPEFTQTTKENIIGFGGGTGSMSRGTKNTGTTYEMLDNQFKVYGWKTVNKTPQKVFDNYWVWYEGTNKTPSNPDATGGADKGWEYVGNAGQKMPFELPNTETQKDQYIKYWDYSASDYRFVAGSPIKSFNFVPSSGEVAIITTTVTDLAGHIKPNPIGGKEPIIKPDPVYLAKPKIVNEAEYKNAVQLTFTRLQTKVRVGIYETIPGYKITNIVFYKQGSTTVDTEDDNKNNVTLFSATPNYFQGGSDVNATVTYNWDATPTPTYTVEYQNGTSDNLETDYNWYGGKFDNGVPAESSNPTTPSSKNSTIIKDLYGTDDDMDETTGYFTVLSTTKEPSPLVIKCDFTLKAVDTNEEINVTGATAAIPAAYCKWDENKMYTYIFKISQETNGTTGTTGDKEGLFPITFDATAIYSEEGVETIVQTPSITTHQTGCVVTTGGIEYKTKTAIDITVMNEGTALTLNKTKDTQGYIAVYNLGATEADAKTEAELTVTAPSVTPETVQLTTEGSGSYTNKATFTPEDAGYYAIQYCYKVESGTPVYKYKVIKVKKVN